MGWSCKGLAVNPLLIALINQLFAFRYTYLEIAVVLSALPGIASTITGTTMKGESHRTAQKTAMQS
jgi:hypothetical protein